MLSQNDAREALLSLWNDARGRDLKRLQNIRQALDPTRAHPGSGERGRRSTVTIPDDAPQRMLELARKAETNYLPLLVRTYSQALRVDGYLTSAPSEQNPMRWWERNRMGARQVGIHDSALSYGTAYALVGRRADSPTGDPRVRIFTPFTMTAIFADDDEWPMLAAYQDGDHLVLVDEVAEYRFGLEDSRPLWQRISSPLPKGSLTSSGLSFLEPALHGMGHVPVVRYKESMLAEGEERLGIVEPLMVIQERIDETQFNHLVAQHCTAFKSRAIIGWVPKSEEEEMSASAGRAFYLDEHPDDVRIQEMGEASLTAYNESGAKARRDFAALGQLPPGDIGVDSISNISDATLAGLEAAKNRRSGEIATSIGESHEQLLRLFAAFAGDQEAASDYSSEVRWAEREARSWAGSVDGLVKLVQGGILARATAIGMVPGFSDQQVTAALADARAERGSQVLDSLRAAAGGPPLSAPAAPGSAAAGAASGAPAVGAP